MTVHRRRPMIRRKLGVGLPPGHPDYRRPVPRAVVEPARDRPVDRQSTLAAARHQHHRSSAVEPEADERRRAPRPGSGGTMGFPVSNSIVCGPGRRARGSLREARGKCVARRGSAGAWSDRGRRSAPESRWECRAAPPTRLPAPRHTRRFRSLPAAVPSAKSFRAPGTPATPRMATVRSSTRSAGRSVRRRGARSGNHASAAAPPPPRASRRPAPARARARAPAVPRRSPAPA